jgi:hypothetical protein
MTVCELDNQIPEKFKIVQKYSDDQKLTKFFIIIKIILYYKFSVLDLNSLPILSLPAQSVWDTCPALAALKEYLLEVKLASNTYIH